MASAGTMSNLSFQLPDLLALTNSFPFRMNKNCKLATDGSQKWLLDTLDGSGEAVLLDKEKETLGSVKYGLLASLCSPTSDAPQLRILTDYFSLIFVSHVRILECRESTRSVSRGWSSQWSSSIHIESAEDGLELLSTNALLQSIVPPIKRISSRLAGPQQRQWKQRFTKSVKAFAKAQLRLYENLKGDAVPTLPEYVKLHREAYGASMFIDLLDLLEISPRPSGLSSKEDNILDQLTTWAIDIVAWILDIFSYASGTTGTTRCNSHNLVALLTTHKNLSVQGAMNYAGGMVKEALEELHRLERELIHASPPPGASWGWLSLVKSAVGFSETHTPRPIWKFLADVVIPQPPVGECVVPHLSPEVLEQQNIQTTRYVRALKDYIIGSIHWGYESELYFGQKGDEVRSFGWVFLPHNDHDTAIGD